MISTEATTLTAIARLEPEFPSAATLLVYVTLERCLKLFLLEERNTLTDADVDLTLPVGKAKPKVTLAACRHLDEAAFVRTFLASCSLGTLERLYRMPTRKYSAHRNEVFHSGLYLQNLLGQDYAARHAENMRHLGTAKQHLIEASTLYFRPRIVNDGGLLRFES